MLMEKKIIHKDHLNQKIQGGLWIYHIGLSFVKGGG